MNKFYLNRRQILNIRSGLAMAAAASLLTAAMGCTPPASPELPSPPPPLESVPATAADAGLQDFYSTSDPDVIPEALAAFIPPNHTHLAPGRNGMHENTTNSDVTNAFAPTGIPNSFSIVTHQLDPQLVACPSVLFTDNDDIVTACYTLDLNTGELPTNLYLLDGETLAILDTVVLPTKLTRGDAAGGGYLHKLANGEILISPSDQSIRTYAVNGTQLVESSTLSLSNELATLHSTLDTTTPGGRFFEKTAVDHQITDVVYDFDGNLWFTVNLGIIGVIDATDQNVYTLVLPETLQNAAAIDPTGVYLTTFNHFLKFEFDAAEINSVDGPIVELWDRTYDNTGAGVLGGGSGTTPTIFGDTGQWIAITDNHATQLHLNVYDTATGADVCQADVFAENAGATENSPIGYGNSIALINNYGWEGFFGDPRSMTAGYEKINVELNAAQDGYDCNLDWSEPQTSATVPMLSTQTGLVYMTSVKEGTNDDYGFYFVAIDWKTGKEVFSKWVGNGEQFDPALMLGAFNGSGEYIAPTRFGFYKLSGL